MSKRHADRPKVDHVSEQAQRLAELSCPHGPVACDNCRYQCQRDIDASNARRRT